MSCETADLVASYFSLIIRSVVRGVVVGGLVSRLRSPFFLFDGDKGIVLGVVLLGFFVFMSCTKWSWGGFYFTKGVWFVRSMWNFKFISAQPLAGVVLTSSDLIVVRLEKG